MGQKPIAVNKITNLYEYLESIDWEEPWLWGVIAFHFLAGILTGVAILLRKMHFQAFIFCIYLLLISAAEHINTWAAANYKLFSAQQYFDSNGMFISLTLSTPLLINSLAIVIAWVWQTSSMLITVKRAQLRSEVQQQDKKKS